MKTRTTRRRMILAGALAAAAWLGVGPATAGAQYYGPGYGLGDVHRHHPGCGHRGLGGVLEEATLVLAALLDDCLLAGVQDRAIGGGGEVLHSSDEAGMGPDRVFVVSVDLPGDEPSVPWLASTVTGRSIVSSCRFARFTPENLATSSMGRVNRAWPVASASASGGRGGFARPRNVRGDGGRGGAGAIPRSDRRVRCGFTTVRPRHLRDSAEDHRGAARDGTDTCPRSSPRWLRT